MRKSVLLILCSLLLLPAGVFAQAQPWDSLIISEINLSPQAGNNQLTWGYIELCNTSSKAIDTRDFWVSSSVTGGNFPSGGESRWKMNLRPMMLPPGGVYIICGRSTNNTVNALGQPMYPRGSANIYVEAMADQVTYHEDQSFDAPGARIHDGYRFGIFYRGDTSKTPGVVQRDSVLVDKFWFENKDMGVGEPSPETNKARFPIAGVVTDDPPFDYIYVRKFKFKKGNTDFNQSRGTNKDDSEWIVLPQNQFNIYAIPYTTVGYHGNQAVLDVTPKNADITIDKAGKKITFPYGIRRDSVFRQFNIGPGHAWEFITGNDTSQFYVSNSDSIDFYVCGNEGQKYRFACVVANAPASFPYVRPVIVKNTNGVWSQKYTVSNTLALDTIGNVNFNEPIDTLLKYLVLEPGASAHFEWVDGVKRPELKNGDKLIVTAGNLVKEYKIGVNIYIKNHNATIQTIYFPGLELWENPSTFAYTDTMLDFVPGSNVYQVKLPEGTVTSPAIVAVPQDSRANVTVVPAKNLNGSADDKTVVIKVAAEDDTTIQVYKIIFDVERPVPPIEGEPFFTDFCSFWGNRNGGGGNQIFNPKNEPITLSDYLIAKVLDNSGSLAGWSNSRLVDADFAARNKFVLVPGYKVGVDINGNNILESDDLQTTFELGPQEVYSMIYPAGFPGNSGGNGDLSTVQKIDMVGFDGKYPAGAFGSVGAPNYEYWLNRFGGAWDAYDEVTGKGLFNGLRGAHSATTGVTHVIFKILNDSIIEGTKPYAKDFDKDYEIVDIVNGFGSLGVKWEVYEKTFMYDTTSNKVGTDTVWRFDVGGDGYKNSGLYRKSHVYTGNSVERASFGTKGNNGEWGLYGLKYGDPAYGYDRDNKVYGNQGFGQSRFENHVMVTYAHIPYITSSVYNITTGISSDESIFGVVTGTTIDQFMANILKPDEKMMVVVKDKNGIVKEGSDLIIATDKVTSTAANGLTSVTYSFILGALSNDASLIGKAGSGITVTGANVNGIMFGMTLPEFIEKVQPAQFSVMEILDKKRQIVPQYIYSKDTIVTEEQGKVPTLVSSAFNIKVVAQNGIDSMVYSLNFANEEDVFVLSNVYKVYEQFKTIDFVNWTSVERFLEALIPSPGAEMYVVNKMGQKRDIGGIQFDDKLVVEKGTKKSVYIMKFVNDRTKNVNTKDVHSQLALKAYPNPTTGLVSVAVAKGAEGYVLTNLAGQVIMTGKVNGETLTLQLQNKMEGVYFVTYLKDNKQLNTVKIVKE